jgi:hypothetical protein
VELGQSKGDGGYGDRDGKIGHFDDEVTDLYQECKMRV